MACHSLSTKVRARRPVSARCRASCCASPVDGRARCCGRWSRARLARVPASTRPRAALATGFCYWRGAAMSAVMARQTRLCASPDFRACCRSARSHAYSWESRLSRSVVRARPNLLSFSRGTVGCVLAAANVLCMFSRHGCFGTGPRAPHPARTPWLLRILRASRGKTAKVRRACLVNLRFCFRCRVSP